jgi:hypothetical protein
MEDAGGASSAYGFWVHLSWDGCTSYLQPGGWRLSRRIQDT